MIRALLTIMTIFFGVVTILSALRHEIPIGGFLLFLICLFGLILGKRKDLK
jgi:uncharacterized membrane protein HdeD (DUF308 family)